MPSRDYEQYINLTIRLKKGSKTHQALMKDADEIGTKQLPTVAAMRLADFYRHVESGIPFSSGTSSKQEYEESGVIDNATAADSEWPE